MTLPPLETRAPGTAAAQGRVRQIDWTGFNQPLQTSHLNKTVAFTYDQDHQRIREVATDGAKQRTLDLLHPDNQGGLAYEREETRLSGTLTSTENRHYISVAGSVVAVVKTNNDSGTIGTTGRIDYWHKDALGSIVAVSDRAGTVIEQVAFDAWGKRTRSNGNADPTIEPSHGDRGFTGHEHLDEVQLVHMNGRVYDPLLGKFLSVDPVVGNPNDLQTYNRYSYVYNQPTRYADATGMCPWCPFVFLVGALAAHEGNKYWSVVGKIAMIWAAPQLIEAGLGNASALTASGNAGAAVGMTGAEASAFNIGGLGNSFLAASGSSLAGGASAGDALRDGAFAMAFTSVGSGFKGQSPQLLASHAFLGCVQSAASGGKCGPGAMSAVIGKATTLGLAGQTNRVTIGVVTTIAGGTASVIGGGKFGNGAFQAGFGYVFNNLTAESATGSYDDGLQRVAGTMSADQARAFYIGVFSLSGDAASLGSLFFLGWNMPVALALDRYAFFVDGSLALSGDASKVAGLAAQTAGADLMSRVGGSTRLQLGMGFVAGKGIETATSLRLEQNSAKAAAEPKRRCPPGC